MCYGMATCIAFISRKMHRSKLAIIYAMLPETKEMHCRRTGMPFQQKIITSFLFNRKHNKK